MDSHEDASPQKFMIEHCVCEINKSNFHVIQQFSYKNIENDVLRVTLSILEEYRSWDRIIMEKFQTMLKGYIDVSKIQIIIDTYKEAGEIYA